MKPSEYCYGFAGLRPRPAPPPPGPTMAELRQAFKEGRVKIPRRVVAVVDENGWWAPSLGGRA